MIARIYILGTKSSAVFLKFDFLNRIIIAVGNIATEHDFIYSVCTRLANIRYIHLTFKITTSIDGYKQSFLLFLYSNENNFGSIFRKINYCQVLGNFLRKMRRQLGPTRKKCFSIPSEGIF